MRITVGSVVAVAAALLASPAAAEPVAFVKFSGAVGEQAQTVAPAGDVNGDGHDDVIIGAPTASTPGGDYVGAAGAAYVVYGPFAAGTTIELAQLGDKGFRIQGAGAEGTGSSVAGAGDVNGDGLADVLIGAPLYSERRGRAYVVFGRRRPRTVDLAKLGRHGITLRGERHKTIWDNFGLDVAPLGDINRDGLADVGIVAGGEVREPPYVTPGNAYVVFGRRRGGSLAMADLGRAGFRIGSAVGMQGISTAGDWNADGRPDLALTGTARRGARTWIVYGRRYRGTVNLSRLGEKGALIRGPGGEGPSHATVAGGEDVDGDHRPDIVIGTPWTHAGPSGGSMPPFRGGGVWVVRGSRSRATVDLDHPGRRAWEIARGDPAGMAFTGEAVALGRFDADGLADVAVTGGGPLAVLFGSASRRPRQLSALAPDEGFLVPALVEGGFHGVATAGDMNGDGRDDVLVGAPGILSPYSLPAGAGYLIFTP